MRRNYPHANTGTPIYSPMTPFQTPVSLHTGFMVFVNGVPTGGRFSVNLKAGPEDHCDNAFHFNPRFDQGNVVVRNTKRNGGWESEERQSNGFPFVMGQPFEMIILCQQNQYKVAVNGRHFIEYRHRMNINSVRSLTVEGSVKLSMIRFDQESTPQHPPQPAAAPKTINNPANPCLAVVPFNNIKNRRVTIMGVPENRHPHRFNIDFQTASAPHGSARPDVFFHFNPRIPERVIVRNALKNGGWGGEERQMAVPFPFQYGVPYQLVFIVDQNYFRVQLNGMEICVFAHRQRPLNLIRNINIAGSTSISRVSFE